MRFPIVVLAAILVASGCLSQRHDDQRPGDMSPTPSVDWRAPRTYSGSVEVGENTTEDPSLADDAALHGTSGQSYVSTYGPEPNVGVTSNGYVFTSAFSAVMRSKDQGRTWEKVQEHLQGTQDTNNDPMLWVDPWTDRVYNAPMFPALRCASLYWSDDAGDVWTPTPAPACSNAPFDHQKLTSGPPPSGVNPVAGRLYPTNTYLCYNGVGVTSCMVSYDGGRTWPVDRPTVVNTAAFFADVVGAGGDNPNPYLSECLSGQNGHPMASRHGVVAFFRTWSCLEPILTYSTDGGLTWQNAPGPEFPGGPWDINNDAAFGTDPEVAWTPDDTLYVLFQNPDNHAFLARTHDLGATWQGPWDVTPPGIGSTVFAAMAAEEDGRVAMAFLGAQNYTGSASVAPNETRWHMWSVVSLDAEAEDPTFTAYQMTPDEDPVQIGLIFLGQQLQGNDRNLLDFIDGSISPDGTFYVAFTDGCGVQNNCSGQPRANQTNQYRGSEGNVAWLEGVPLLSTPRVGRLPIELGDARPGLPG